jgi:hypothetical protein
MMIGTSSTAGTRRHTSRPSTSGSITSSTTRSGASRSIVSSVVERVARTATHSPDAAARAPSARYASASLDSLTSFVEPSPYGQDPNDGRKLERAMGPATTRPSS